MVQLLFSSSLVAITSSILFTSVIGHMTMKTPAPFAFNDPSNALAPLQPNGADFPCKVAAGGSYTPPAQTNTLAIGEDQTLSFSGSAVHGGGSCQISLTSDKAPTKDSKWQVIHSIHGGCPADPGGAMSEGNLQGGEQPSQFKYQIPDGIAAGEYVLAWTWFNKIGNREMYMNCAPVVVTPPKKRRYAPLSSAISKRQTSFPDLAIANIGNGCATVEQYEVSPNNFINAPVRFPDPGPSVESSPSFAAQHSEFKATGDQCYLVNAASGSSGSTGSTGSSAASPSQSAITQTSAGVFASGASTASAASATSAAASVEPVTSSAAPVASSSVQSSAASSPTGTTSSGSAPASGSGSGSASVGASCTEEGSTQCSADGQSYTICASGYWQTMPVAAGTKCEGTGVQANINIVATNVKSKRHVHAREHLGRRGHA